MAVVKADGYGHGLVPAARAALAGGATWLGVAHVHEALALRAAGVDADVLAWILTPGTDLVPAVRAGVDLSVAAVWALEEVAAAARATGTAARVHLEVDTGMSRGGASPGEWPALLDAVAKHVHDGVLRVARHLGALRQRRRARGPLRPGPAGRVRGGAGDRPPPRRRPGPAPPRELRRRAARPGGRATTSCAPGSRSTGSRPPRTSRPAPSWGSSRR